MNVCLLLLHLMICSVFLADILQVWTSFENCDVHEEQLVVNSDLVICSLFYLSLINLYIIIGL